jgi:hypothetical protein
MIIAIIVADLASGEKTQPDPRRVIPIHEFIWYFDGAFGSLTHRLGVPPLGGKRHAFLRRNAAA